MQFERIGLVVPNLAFRGQPIAVTNWGEPLLYSGIAVEEQQDEHGLCYEQVAPTG